MEAKMVSTITTAMVKQYSSNVFHLVQQQGSRLLPFVRKESMHSEEMFFDNLDSVTAMEKTSRNADVVYDDPVHGRRRVTFNDYYYSTLVDKEDKLRLIISPESEYAIAARNALGRKIDDIIISSSLGIAYTGKNGVTAKSLASELGPDGYSSQVMASFDGTTTTGVGMTIKTLREIKKKFNANETGDSDLYCVISAFQLDELLGQDQVQSADYNSVKALVNGDVETFMGFKFIRTERLPVVPASPVINYDPVNGKLIPASAGTVAVNSRRCFAFQREGVLLGMAAEVNGRIDQIPQKHYATQVYASMSLGGTRMEEKRVVEFYCKEV